MENDISSKVAERFVSLWKKSEKISGDFKSENADMSNEKSCDIHDRRKSKGFYDT